MAACGALSDSPVYGVLRFVRLFGMLHDECKIDWKQGLGGCWMINETLVGRRSNTLELEVLGGYLSMCMNTKEQIILYI